MSWYLLYERELTKIIVQQRSRLPPTQEGPPPYGASLVIVPGMHPAGHNLHMQMPRTSFVAGHSRNLFITAGLELCCGIGLKSAPFALRVWQGRRERLRSRP